MRARWKVLSKSSTSTQNMYTTTIYYSLDMAIRTRVKDQSSSGSQRGPGKGPIGSLGPQLRTIDRPSESDLKSRKKLNELALDR